VKKGLIYQEGTAVGEVKVSVLILGLRWLARILSWAGSGLVIVSVLGLVFVYIPLGVAEVRYTLSKTQLAKVVREWDRKAWAQKLEEEKVRGRWEGKPGEDNLPKDWVVPDRNYSIYIPKIFAVSKVIPNVDAGNPKVYLPALKQGVAEAMNLAHPGQKGTTYLFAHSVGSRWDFARYNAVFYLLEKLEVGDRVEVVYQEKLFKYEVVEREILTASDVKYLVPQGLTEKLVLSTCYPPGTTWKRLVVVAKRI
jgi:LPXTG-site transpeptidase (sortase) family protein